MALLTYFQNISHSPNAIFQIFIFAFIGGLLPALIWLWFWMHESHDHNEPKTILWLTFVVGMVGVFFVFPLQALVGYLFGLTDNPNDWLTVVVWAGLEEIIKFTAAYIIALHLKPEVFDEPIDAFVYLMTAALGFSAMENMLFLIGPLFQGDTISSLMTGNLRFMGANLLHVASSGVLSLFVSFAFYKPKWAQRMYTAIGLVVATVLHALFNFLIILLTSVQKEMIFVAFSYVWITLIILILALERVKTMKEF